MDEYLQNTGQGIDEGVEGRNSAAKDGAEEGELPEERISNKSAADRAKAPSVSLDSSFLSPKNNDSFQFLLPTEIIYLPDTRSLLLEYTDKRMENLVF